MQIAVKAISLFYSNIATGGTSDKEYHVQIETKGSGYVVLFQFGRRGGTLQAGTKTPVPVTLEEAESIYARLVREKVSEGYQESNTTAKAPAAPGNGWTKYPVELLEEIGRERVDALVRSPMYYLQVKVDGHRRQIEKRADGTIVSYNRKGEPTSLPRNIFTAISDQQGSFFIDGELVGDTFIAFDMFKLNGVEMSPLPYAERLQTLERTIEKSPYLTIVVTWKTIKEKQAGLQALYANRCEGAVFKLTRAPYRPGRNGQHKKFKFIKSCTAKVIRMGDKGHNSATLALLDGKTWREVGNVSMNGKDSRIRIGSLVEVIFLYATEGRRLYQPRIQMLRTDIKESDCTFAQLKNSYKEGVAA